MPSLWGLRLGRYDPTTSKPSKGWCNDVPYDDSDAEAEWEEYIRRQRSLGSNQLDNESVASLKTEDASEEAIDNEIEESTREVFEQDLDADTFHYQLESPASRFLTLPVRVTSEVVSVDDESVKNNAVADDNNAEDTETDAIAAKYVTPDQLNEVDDDFDDEIFALTPETCPSPSGSPRAVLPKVPLRIFVATWNMAAKDPFAHRRRGQYIGDVLAAETLRELLPLGYDIYAIGTQEKVTKHLHAAVLARLNQQPVASLQNTEQMYQRLELTAKRRWLHSRRRREDECQHWRTYQSSDFGNVSSVGLSSFCTSELPCGTYSPNASFCCGDVPSPQSPVDTEDSDAGCSWWNKERGEKEIRGRGDHAFIRRKSTGLVVYYASHLHGQLEVVAAGVHKFTGSKGGVAVTIRVAGDPQTLTFVNCHLEAHKIERRRRQLDKLARALPRSLELNTTLAKCSDHVVWMGDFNYRIQVLEGSEVLHYLTAGRLQELHDHYDSMTEDLKHVPGLKSFREPAKWPTFYPTYKKVASRSRLPLSGSTTGTGRDTRWAQHVYQTTYREPFYKGGRVRERVPGWCDRILYCSRADSPWENCFKVEQVACSDSSLGRSSFGSDTVRDNYRALNDELRGSDHSPVSCTFLWSVQR
ncbi:Endonuclease/Exonuclease/phosphatase family [Phytophthora infestans]|uniref:Endonuclease/Exonuclease/phosphatase family n=1 Tax=Phytophthora infestans TaxID=4787 RepID=A0A8S9UBF6_PHYIN|nr:Endonuclease/Exonuclease/phosphatase family [Phytophthora infestans]